MITKYSGKRLVAIYEVKSSENNWYMQKVYIESQKEFNDLINVCNKNMETMNLVDIMEAKEEK